MSAATAETVAKMSVGGRLAMAAPGGMERAAGTGANINGLGGQQAAGGDDSHAILGNDPAGSDRDIDAEF